MSNIQHIGSTASEDLLPIVIKAIVSATEQTVKMNVNTDLIVQKLNNGLGSEIRSIPTILRNEVLPKLNLEAALVEARKVETEIKSKAQIEEIRARKEMYKEKYKFYGMLATLLCGGGGLLFAVLKWLVIPILGLPPVQ